MRATHNLYSQMSYPLTLLQRNRSFHIIFSNISTKILSYNKDSVIDACPQEQNLILPSVYLSIHFWINKLPILLIKAVEIYNRIQIDRNI